MQHDCNGSVAVIIVVVVAALVAAAASVVVTVDDIVWESKLYANKFEKFCKFRVEVSIACL